MKKRVVKSDRSGEIRWGGGRGGGLFIDQARAFVLEHGPRFNSRAYQSQQWHRDHS